MKVDESLLEAKLAKRFGEAFLQKSTLLSIRRLKNPDPELPVLVGRSARKT
jgi:hypothetical protein